jgi:hypothetical protein
VSTRLGRDVLLSREAMLEPLEDQITCSSFVAIVALCCAEATRWYYVAWLRCLHLTSSRQPIRLCGGPFVCWMEDRAGRTLPGPPEVFGMSASLRCWLINAVDFRTRPKVGRTRRLLRNNAEYPTWLAGAGAGLGYQSVTGGSFTCKSDLLVFCQ